MDQRIEGTYTEDKIEILEGLDAVRKRPGMYIGSTDSRGLHHLIWEIIDNAIDEAMEGHGSKIVVTIGKDGAVTVQDEGRGIPIGMHKSGIPTPQVVYTILHSGGKFNDGTYKSSSGLHGVGASIVTALSEYLDVTVYRDGKIFHQRYNDGAKVILPAEIMGNSHKTGVKVQFKANPFIFSTIEINRSLVAERMQEHAFLLKGVEMVLVDERIDKTESFLYDNGLVSYLDFINEGRIDAYPPIYFHGEINSIEIEVAFKYVKESYEETFLSFANNIRTRDGGTHETGLRSGFTRALNDFAKKYALIKEKDKIEGSDYREGLTAIVSVHIPEKLLQFEGQTKNKLGSAEAKTAVEYLVYEKFSYFLEENKETSNDIILRAISASHVRESARKARDNARSSKKNSAERLLSGKLTPCQSKNAEITELFLVEGDSAGGTAKQGRDRTFQAILPLRGKVINSEKTILDELLKNEEIASIIHAIGAEVGKEFRVDERNYSKVIIMTDADTDGAHIQVLLLTFFYRYMRPLVETGHVFLAMPPLYKVYKPSSKGEKFLYVWDDNGLEEARQKIGSGSLIQRYKGLGEMNTDQLWETTMNPQTRSLIKVTIEDAIIADRRISVLMGSDSRPRRTWIEENVQFTLEDSYQVQGD